MATWGLDRRFIIGESGAPLRKMAMHRETSFYNNSRTTLYNK
jgi:hypothetical protein